MKNLEFELREGEDFIPLASLIKAVNLVENGAQALHVVEEGLVKRNGEVELRKRAKIRAGEVIEVDEYRITVK
jgi:ribosome-associated protein